MTVTLIQNFTLVVRTNLVTEGNMILKVMGRYVGVGSRETWIEPIEHESMGGGKYIYIYQLDSYGKNSELPKDL